MIIDGKKIAKIEIQGPDNNVVAVLEDDGARTAKGYKVNVLLDYRLGPDAIALPGDVMHFVDDEEQKYVVTNASDKFFTLVPVEVHTETEEITYKNEHQRVYPNRRSVGTLSDYGLVLEFRGDQDGSEEKESNSSCD